MLNESSLRLNIQAQQSVISTYAQELAQMREITTQLLSDKLGSDVTELSRTVIKHLEERQAERSTQYLALLQTTLIAVTELHLRLRAGQDIENDLLSVVKSLTLSTNV